MLSSYGDGQIDSRPDASLCGAAPSIGGGNWMPSDRMTRVRWFCVAGRYVNMLLIVNGML